MRWARSASNGLGLHDMCGNVCEWCGDWYADDYYKELPADDPRGPLQAANRVPRGGSWGSYSVGCRSAQRLGDSPDFRRSLLGFRLAMNRTELTPNRPLADAIPTRNGGTELASNHPVADAIPTRNGGTELASNHPVADTPSTRGGTELTPHRPLADTITTRTGGIKLNLIPAGEFLMGSPDEDKEAGADEKPQHRVRITRPFYLGVYEVTQAQYEAVMGDNPSYFSSNTPLHTGVQGRSTDLHPVEDLSWLSGALLQQAERTGWEDAVLPD